LSKFFRQWINKAKRENRDIEMIDQYMQMIDEDEVLLVRNSGILHPTYTVTEDTEKTTEVPPEETERTLTLLERLLYAINWEDKNMIQKVTLATFEWFLVLIRNVTIPIAETERWNKYYAMSIPLFSPLLILTAVNPKYLVYMIAGKVPIICILLVVGALVSLIISFSTERQNAPRFHIVCTIV
jgi:hypothetical protein